MTDKKSRTNIHDVLIELIRHLPFPELSLVALAGVILGGFAWRYPDINGLWQENDGDRAYFATLGFFFILAGACIVILWRRTDLTAQQLDAMTDRDRGPRIDLHPGLPTIEEYGNHIQRAADLEDRTEQQQQ